MEYFSAALCALALIALASLLLPSREGVRRAALSALSLLLLFMLIPWQGIDLESILSFPEAESAPTTSEEYVAVWKEGVENGITLDLCDRFSLVPSGITVDLTLSFEDEVKITALSLTLSGKNATADATGMLLYLEECYGVYAKIHLNA